MTTLHDIAEKAHVSKMTVSRYFNAPEKLTDKTKAIIGQVIEELDYQPNQIARSLATKRTDTIGIVVPDITNNFFSVCYRSIEKRLDGTGQHLILCNSDEDEKKELENIQTLLARRVDGMIIMPVSKKNIEFLQDRNVKFVLVDRTFDNTIMPFVATDNHAGAILATEYLIGLGHQKIAIIKGPTCLSPYAERFRGYCDTLSKYNIPVNECYIKQSMTTGDAGKRAILELIHQSNPPTAVYISNNVMGVGAIEALNETGLRIPEEISILVNDKMPSHNLMKPKFTCISQPVEKLGREAASLMLDMITNGIPNNPQKILLKPELVEGESCVKNE